MGRKIKYTGTNARGKKRGFAVNTNRNKTNFKGPVQTQATINVPPTEVDEIRLDVDEDLATTLENVNIINSDNATSQQKPYQEQPTGLRIFDPLYFLLKLKDFEMHGRQFGCNLSNFNIVHENRDGLFTSLKFVCNICNAVQHIPLINPLDEMKLSINNSFVAGGMNVGGGYNMLCELLSSINMPFMSSKKYSQVHKEVCSTYEKIAISEMSNAANEEKQISIEEGHIDKDGIPEITVVCDGAWSKRSYRTNYNAMSGVGAIIGYRTKKVLYVHVKNKYCLVCARAENANLAVKRHDCYKNWTDSSPAMESASIVEGFNKSIELHGLKYKTMIADGDSSCYKKLLESRPYGMDVVEKIECRNHLFRNFCNKLRDLSNAKIGPKVIRSELSNKILKLRCSIYKAVKYRKNENIDTASKILNLKNDILNAPSHIFGEHKNCANYFCDKKRPDKKNTMEDFKLAGLYERLMTIFRLLSTHAKSLIYDVDSNIVEQYNSIICKFVGGKRINYTLKGSYQARCFAAVISHNSKKPFYKFYKYCTSESPKKYAKRYEHSKATKKSVRQIFRPKHKPKMASSNRHYGDFCEKPDISTEDFEIAKEMYLFSLKKSEKERELFEIRTRDQSNCVEWLEERRKLLTASNFGTICKRKPYTSCANLVNTIIYKDYAKGIRALDYGKQNKPLAISELSALQAVEIVPCGMFLDSQIPYLGATPDGLVGADGIVEVKCPYSAREMTPDQGILTKKILFWKNDTVDKKHKWFFQIQGQLHVTQKQYCLFCVWTPKGIKTEIICRDDQFWEDQMLPHLSFFYLNCILPELLDPRKTRNMAIRDPKQILEAQEEYRNKKQKKRK